MSASGGPPRRPGLRTGLSALARRLSLAAEPVQPVDRRGRRVVVVIECLLNQNARDPGAASFAALVWDLVSLCHEHDIGMLQMPCPEMACLGLARTRPCSQSIRDAMLTPASQRGCAQLGAEVADRIEAFVSAGYRVLAVLGGNPQSPGCAVHREGADLQPASGVLMLALHAELRRRGLEIPFRAVRDSDAQLLAEDLHGLRTLFCV